MITPFLFQSSENYAQPLSFITNTRELHCYLQIIEYNIKSRSEWKNEKKCRKNKAKYYKCWDLNPNKDKMFHIFANVIA